MKENVHFCLGGPDELEELVPLMRTFNAEEGIEWRPDTMGAALHRLLQEPELGLVVLARHRASGALAGYGLGTFGYDVEFSGLDAFITELFIAPSFRGQGMGRRLLEAVVAALRDREVRAIHLMVRPENARARALYASCGFTTVPRLVMTKRVE